MYVEDALKQVFETFEPDVLIDFFRTIGVRTLNPLKRNYDIQADASFFCIPYLLGTIRLENEEELAVFTIKVVKSLTERSGKKAQYELAKKILKTENRYPAGIFIFHDDKNDFRFSLVYNIPLATGKRDWSNFRRYTYFVSKEQTNKTLIHQIAQADFSSIETLTEAFSVEKVTKAFYAELQNWYFWAMNIVEFPDDEDKDKNSRNAKNLIRLITRIIFIWFMKEKRLIPSSLFEKQFVDNLLNYNDKTGSTYYKAILQNLFFATLNTKMRKDDSKSRIFVEDAQKMGYISDAYLQQGYYRYSRFIKDKEKFIKEFENIPFLNGGLFECLDKKIDEKEVRIDCFSDNPKNETRLKVPDVIFFSEEEVDADLSAFLENNNRRKVRGLIPILNNYNFTTDENTPIDEEVALDPELLGKVFENLLASYNPETAVTARKATGSYYTPREIVDYMVTESLVMHLAGTLGDEPKTIEKLNKLFSYSDDSNLFDAEETESIISSIEKIRILDPACGSGAFPMGILHKLVLALHKLDPQNTKWKKRLIEGVPPELQAEVEQSLQNKSLDYIRKLGLIEHCIFGVDIQEIAIQISKLRFFISLLIEQEIDDSKENRDIRALPNLETKFVAANTLIELGESQSFKSQEVINLEEELFIVRERIFYTNSRKEKHELQRKLTDIRNQLKTELARVGFQNDKAEKITQWDPFDQNTHAEWFDPEWMFGVKTGFDIVIGNPPYIKEYTLRNAFNGLRTSQYYKGKMDIWYLFACKGIDLLKNNTGILTYIAQNNWITSYGASKMRNKVIQDTKILQMIDFGTYMIFENSDIQTMIMMFKSDTKTDNYTFDYRKLEGKDLHFNDVLDMLNHKQNPKTIYFKPTILRNKFVNKLLTFSDTKFEAILDKISEQNNFKLTENEVAQGIVPNPDVVTKTSIGKIPSSKIKKYNINVGDGVFVIKHGTLNVFTKQERKILKPLWEPNEISRFYICNVNNYDIIYFTKSDSPEDYPNIILHLIKYKEIMEGRRENRQGKISYYHLHWPRDKYFFEEGPKILGVRKCNVPTFAYTEREVYVMMAINVIKTERINLKYLTALLNSKLIAFWLKHKGKMQGENYQIDKEPLLALPIKKIPNKEQQPFIDLVDKILAAKKDNPQADTGTWEREIDRLVYELYELTEEEKAIVENKK